MNDQQFLEWLTQRLVHQYGESENVGFVLKLKALASKQNQTATFLTRISRLNVNCSRLGQGMLHQIVAEAERLLADVPPMARSEQPAEEEKPDMMAIPRAEYAYLMTALNNYRDMIDKMVESTKNLDLQCRAWNKGAEK